LSAQVLPAELDTFDLYDIYLTDCDGNGVDEIEATGYGAKKAADLVYAMDALSDNGLTPAAHTANVEWAFYYEYTPGNCRGYIYLVNDAIWGPTFYITREKINLNK
jgi:hypothetical protein